MMRSATADMTTIMSIIITTMMRSAAADMTTAVVKTSIAAADMNTAKRKKKLQKPPDLLKVRWLFCLLYCLTGAYCPIICWAIRTPSTAALIMPPA